MSGIEIKGADDFYRLSKALKAAKDKNLRSNLHKGMARAARPLVRVAKEAAQQAFPRGGGLNEREAKIPFRSTVSTARATAGVRITAPGRFVNAKTSNATGHIRHPVFGDKRSSLTKWVDQDLGNAGWFDDAMNNTAGFVRPEIEQAVKDTLDQIVKEVRRR